MPSLCRRVPLDDASLQRLSLGDGKTAKVIPSNTLAATVVAGDLAAHFLRHHQRLCNSVLTEEERPVRQTIHPSSEAARSDIIAAVVDAVRDVGLLDKANALELPNFAVVDHLEAFITILIYGFQIILNRAPSRRPSNAEVLVTHVRRDITLLHNVHNRLDVVLMQVNVVRASRSSVRGQRNGSGISAARSHNAQQGLVELIPSLPIKSLLGVVLQNLVDDLLHRMLGQVVKHASVRNGLTHFSHRPSALSDGEIGDLQRRCFGQGCALRSNVVVNVPSEDLALVQALVGEVLRVSELTEFAKRLHSSPKNVGQFQAVHIAAKAVGRPKLTSHDG